MSEPVASGGGRPRVRIAMVGFGRIARDYLAIVRDSDAMELVAVCDTDEAMRQQAAEETGLPVFGSAREMADQVAFEAALVLAPPAAHEHLVIDLLTRRLHVMCEKPLALTASGAGRMLHAASRHEVVLMMASKFRYVPDLIEARRMISSGMLGEPILFENAFCSAVDMTQRWNSESAISGGGVLMDNGCHAFDIVRMLLGPVVRVMAHFGRRVQPIRVEDTVRMMFETTRACVGMIDVSWSVEKAAEHYAAIQGTGGTMQIGWQGSRYRLAGQSEWSAFGTGYDKRAAIGSQLHNFAAVVLGCEEPQVTPEDALASVRTIEAAYRSARVGRWVPVAFSGA